MNYTDERDAIWKQIEEADTFFIYGAQVVSYGVYIAIKDVIGKEPEAFIVSFMGDNPVKIHNIPVVELNKNVSIFSLVIVATPEIYHKEIEDKLKQHGVEKCIYIDTHKEYLIMSRYFRRVKRFRLLEDFTLTDGRVKPSEKESSFLDVKMFMAKYHKDPALKERYSIPPWIQAIQVGAALTDQRIARLQDNTGDNISYKNPNYSELTALYWVWKNREDKYQGICHYRRMLLLDDDDFRAINQNHINVVLPLPFVCYPNASGQYSRYIALDDQTKMFQVLKEVSPDYFDAAIQILKGPYLYNYNMFLADRKTFCDFCSWLFPILERVEALCEPKGISRSDRYAGYMGEVLTAIYFLYNKNKLNITHAEKIWMV